MADIPVSMKLGNDRDVHFPWKMASNPELPYERKGEETINKNKIVQQLISLNISPDGKIYTNNVAVKSLWSKLNLKDVNIHGLRNLLAKHDGSHSPTGPFIDITPVITKKPKKAKDILKTLDIKFSPSLGSKGDWINKLHYSMKNLESDDIKLLVKQHPTNERTVSKQRPKYIDDLFTPFSIMFSENETFFILNNRSYILRIASSHSISDSKRTCIPQLFGPLREYNLSFRIHILLQGKAPILSKHNGESVMFDIYIVNEEECPVITVLDNNYRIKRKFMIQGVDRTYDACILANDKLAIYTCRHKCSDGSLLILDTETGIYSKTETVRTPELKIIAKNDGGLILVDKARNDGAFLIHGTPVTTIELKENTTIYSLNCDMKMVGKYNVNISSYGGIAVMNDTIILHNRCSVGTVLCVHDINDGRKLKGPIRIFDNIFDVEHIYDDKILVILFDSSTYVYDIDKGTSIIKFPSIGMSSDTDTLKGVVIHAKLSKDRVYYQFWCEGILTKAVRSLSISN